MCNTKVEAVLIIETQIYKFRYINKVYTQILQWYEGLLI